MRRINWNKLIDNDSVPVASISLLITFGIFLGVFFLVSQRGTRQPINLTDTPVSFAEQILPIQKGENSTQIKQASDENQFFMSGYRFELSNDWKHTKNILGIKDTNFVSNIIEIDSTTATNGDAAQVFYITKGDYTFYISNQYITDTNLFYKDGINYSEILTPEFAPDGLYLNYSSASIVYGNEQEYLIRKQFFSCPNIYTNVCVASGYLPFGPTENSAAVDAFHDFINSIKIYDSK